MPIDDSPDSGATGVTTGAAGLVKSLLSRLRSLCDVERAADVAALEGRLAEGRLRVLLVGEAKRGKSTLGNALLGRDVLPMGVAPLTALTTTVRVGTPERVEVLLNSGKLLTVPPAKLACFVTEPGNPINERGVADVTVFVDTETPIPDIELVDTPGAGSIFAHNTTQAHEALTKMDAAIVVLSADPPISASERDLLRRARDLSVRTLVVLNKVDRLTSSELCEVIIFTATVVNDALGQAEMEVFPCSAKAGLEARLNHDAAAWAHSGMQALADVLWAATRDNGSADLVTSIATAAQRIAESLLDETTLTLRTRELLAQERSEQVSRFVDRLAAMGRLRDEALAVARGEAQAQRAALDESAGHSERQFAKLALDTVRRAFRETNDLDAVQLESQGSAVLQEFIRSKVDAWREQRRHVIDHAVDSLFHRQQELIDAAVSDLRDIAREMLGVELQGSAQTISLPASAGFTYTFGPETGWNEPLISAVRRHLPGRLGRRRVEMRLQSDAQRLVAKHMGRSRSSLQRRLEDAMRTLTLEVSKSFDQHAERARAAVGAADITAPSVPFRGGDFVLGETRDDSSAAELVAKAADLSAILVGLQGFSTAKFANDQAQGGHGGQSGPRP